MDESADYIRKCVDEGSFVHNYNSDDIRRAKSHDWWIKSFLKCENNDIEAAASLFVDCLKWRVKFGVQGIGVLELNDVLAENFIYFHGCDLEGRNLLWLNWNRYQFLSMRRSAERLLVYWLERHTMETENMPFTFIVNFHGCDVHDVDLDFVEFIFRCLNDFYPGCVQQILLFEIPQSMWMTWQDFAKKFLRNPSAVFQMISLDRTSIDAYLPFKYLPPAMGGEDEYVFVMHRLPYCIHSRQKIDECNEFLEPSVTDNQTKIEDELVFLKKTVTFKKDVFEGLSDEDRSASIPSQFSNSSSTSSNFLNNNNQTSEVYDEQNAGLSLGISERDELVLKPSAKGEYFTELTLKNRSKHGCQIFKVKTTAPQKFRVRPTVGVIKAGERQTICLILDKAYERSYRAERFLISAVLTGSREPPSAEALQHFVSIFSSAKPEDTFQIKLNCVMENGECNVDNSEIKTELSASESSGGNCGMKLASLDRDLALFLAERELTILKQINGIRQQLNVNRIIIIVVILIQAIMFLYVIKKIEQVSHSK